jgi:hypothetical protein
MSHVGLATRRTRVAPGDGPVTLDSGNPVWIVQIIVSSTGNEEIVFTDAATVPANVLNIAVGANSTEDVEPNYPFDTGFIIPDPTTAVVTVFWRPSG